MKQVLWSLFFSPALVFLELISFRYTCQYEDGGPDFYGFPFIYRTSNVWVNSLSGEFYVLGCIGNMLFWTVILFALMTGIKRLKIPIHKLTSRVWGVFLLLFGFCIVYSTLSIVDWRYQWQHDFKMDYYSDDIICNREIQFFWN